MAQGTSMTLRRKPRPAKRSFSTSAMAMPISVVPITEKAAK